MDKILQIFTYTDGINDKPFPNEEIQITISDFTYTSQRMGSVNLTASVMCELCLDDYWNGLQYINFNGDRYFITNVPTSSKDNEDTRYKHELEFRSNRAILDNVYFFDVVTSDVSVDRYASNSTNVVFHGDIKEFADRLNYSLKYSGLDYTVVLDDGITSEPKMVSLSSAFISDALKEMYDIFELPYYFVGKEIHIGYTDSEIDHIFKYGADESLLSISKNNSNYRKINLCSGEGSSDNIPFYYPNKTQKGVVGAVASEGNKTVLQDTIKIVDNVKYANSVDLSAKVTYDTSEKVLSYVTYKGDSGDTLNDDENTVVRVYGKLKDGTIQKTKYKVRVRFYVDNSTPIEWSPKVSASSNIHFDIEVEGAKSLIDGIIYSEGSRLPIGEYDLLITYNFYDPTLDGYWYDDNTWVSYSKEHVLSFKYDISSLEDNWNIEGKSINLSDIGIEVNTEPTIGDSFYQIKKVWITPYQNLLPPIYRESLGADRFYPALNDTYISPETEEYYEFENEFNGNNNSELIVSFEDIRPTIVGIKNADNKPIDEILDIAFDLEDSDEVDDEGNYIHPYFFVKLRKTNGVFAFNLLDSAIVASDMYLELTSGNCSAGKFLIGVDSDTLKNPVQVDANGNLKRDKNGNVLWENQKVQDVQNDTINNEVWFALTKDINTFGSVIPNATFNYKPSIGDKFVLTGIHLPESYILAAEDRLEKAIIKYMSQNNSDKFTFSINFSRIFLAENPDILAKLNENSRITLSYNDTLYQLYVNNYTYKANDTDVLPEISVELTDTITVNRGILETTMDSVKNDIFSSLSSVDLLAKSLKYFIRKDTNDYANGTVNFREVQNLQKGAKFGVKHLIDELGNAILNSLDIDGYGIEEDGKAVLSKVFTSVMQSPTFSTGVLGSGFTVKIDENGDSYIEADRLFIRKVLEVVTLVIQELRHVGGQIILTPASMQCTRVEENDDFYRCYFSQKDGEKEIYNQFVVGDQCRCQTFNVKSGVTQDFKNTYYWMLVVGVGGDYIDLSKTDCDKGSTAPMAGDDIVQLGNRSDLSRQSAIVLSAYGEDSPYLKLYRGINSYNLKTENEIVTISPSLVKIIADELRFSTGESVKEYVDGMLQETWVENKTYYAGNSMPFENYLVKAKVETTEPPFKLLTDENGKYLLDENGDYLMYIGLDGKPELSPDWIILKDYNELLDKAITYSDSLFTITKTEIASKVSQSTYDVDKDGILNRVAQNESSIIQQATQIELKVSQTEYDSGIHNLELESKAYSEAQANQAVSTAKVYTDSQISLTNEKIELKVSRDELYAYGNWEEGKEYDFPNMVYFANFLFQARSKTTSPPIQLLCNESGAYLKDYTTDSYLVACDKNGNAVIDSAWEKVVDNEAILNEGRTYTDSQITLTNDKIALKVSQMDYLVDKASIESQIALQQSKLLATGIDIELKKVTLTANTFLIQDNSGNPIAVFEVGEDGKPKLKADYINADGITANNVNVSGKVSTSFNGVRIEINPEDKAIEMYDASDVKVGELSLREYSWSGHKTFTPYFKLYQYTEYEGLITQERSVVASSGAISLSKTTSDGKSRQVIDYEGMTLYNDDKAVSTLNIKSVGTHIGIMAQGRVVDSGYAPVIFYKSFDKGELSVSKLDVGKYRITFPSGWFSSLEDVFVTLTGVGYSLDYPTHPIKATLIARQKTNIDVMTSDDETPNDGAFMFQISSLAGWE